MTAPTPPDAPSGVRTCPPGQCVTFVTGDARCFVIYRCKKCGKEEWL